MEIVSDLYLKKTDKEAVKCPKCHSVFIDNDECESCGYQLNFDPLGLPMGEKSFFALRETYQKECGLLVWRYDIFHNPNSPETNRYVFSLVKRYDVLLDYLLCSNSSDSASRKIFWMELKELIREVIRFHIAPAVLVKKLESNSLFGENELVSARIMEILIEQGRRSLGHESFLERFLSRRVGGVMRVGTLLVASNIVMATIFAAISTYRYLLIN